FLEILPIDSTRSDRPSFFDPIYKTIRTMLVQENVLPAAVGGYVAGRHARIARGQYVADLFTDEQLTTVTQSKDALYWLSPDITEANTPILYRALAGTGRDIYQTVTDGLVPGIVVRPELLFARLTTGFLSGQKAGWLCKLYAALQEHASSDAKAAAALRPI